MNNELTQKLTNAAMSARGNSYAPYSKFPVGAAILCSDQQIFTGCNVENASYGLAICAERSAICNAVSHGENDISTLVIAASPLASPCGACRQFIAEFGMDIEVISVDAEDTNNIQRWNIRELLPDAFDSKMLNP